MPSPKYRVPSFIPNREHTAGCCLADKERPCNVDGVEKTLASFLLEGIRREHQI